MDTLKPRESIHRKIVRLDQCYAIMKHFYIINQSKNLSNSQKYCIDTAGYHFNHFPSFKNLRIHTKNLIWANIWKVINYSTTKSAENLKTA